MEKIGSEAARRQLPALLERAHEGKASLIMKRGKPYAVSPHRINGVYQPPAPVCSGFAVLGRASGASRPLQRWPRCAMSGNDGSVRYPRWCLGDS